jgi:RHS repeat-associated protein
LRSRIDYAYDTVDNRLTRGQLLRIDSQDALSQNQSHRIDYFYDSQSRLFKQEQRLPSDIDPNAQDVFVVGYDYDALSRLAALRYPKLPGQPKAIQASFDYAAADTSNGRLSRVRIDDPLDSDPTVWEALSTDSQDRLVNERSGDGIETQREFDWRGFQNEVSMKTAADSGTVVLMAELYAYDSEGNLVSRERIDGQSDPAESFQYDPLDRLTAATHGTFDAPADTWTYDNLGNITSSLRRGTYSYDPQRPTQVTAVTAGLFLTRSYGYDAVGNQTIRPEGSVLYNDFDLPARIASGRGDIAATFLYTGNGERARKVTPAGTITYVPGLYERHRTAGGVEHRLRVAAGSRDVATLVYRQQGTATVVREPIRYSHADRQGSTSLVAISDPANGLKTKVIESRSYDAFGHVRNPDWTGGFLDGIQSAQIGQGYTGHDDDREFGLVNMKGRMYDAELGRFLTPDPYVDGANASQAWNRYTYVSNNPLRFTDPSGFKACTACLWLSDPEANHKNSSSGASPYDGIKEMMETWAEEDEAFFREGPGGISPTNPDSPVSRQIQRDYERFVNLGEDERREAAIKKERAEIKKRQEARVLAAKRAKEAAAKLGSNGGRSAATGPNALASAACDPGSASCTTTVSGCDSSGTTCSDAVESVVAGASFPPPPPVSGQGMPSTLDPPPVSNSPPTDLKNPKFPGPPGMPRGMGPNGQVSPVPPPTPVPQGNWFMRFLLGIPNGSIFIFIDERQMDEFMHPPGA